MGGSPHELDAGRSTLVKYQTLGHMTDASLGRLASLIKSSCAVSVAAVGILDTDGQWIRSLIGVPEKLVAKFSMLCGFALAQEPFFQIQNLASHPLLADDPLVRGEVGLRFFAGALLRSSKQETIGMLCVFDSKPRVFTASEQETFLLFAAEIENQLQLQTSLKHLRAKHVEHLSRLELFEGIMRAASNIAVISTDIDGTIRLFNSEAERMLGYHADELVGQETPLRFQSPEALNTESQAPALLGALAQQSHLPERVFVRKSGSTFPVSLSVAETRSEEGVLSGFVMIAQDRTEQKEIEKLKDDFISLVSHELRTPLTSILGSLGLVCGGVVGALPDAAVNLLNIANANGKRLLRLINDILDLNKLAAGKLEFDFRPCDITKIVQRSLEANSAYAAQYQTEFRLFSQTDAWVRADADRLLQVMANLLSNAAKFSPAQSPIEVLIEPRRGGVRVSVKDHGPGIPKEFQPFLFERFRQASSDDVRQRGGTGLGLNISRLIVEQHNGQISFETEPGLGTTFFFELPLLAL